MYYAYLPYIDDNATVIASLQTEHEGLKIVDSVAVTIGTTTVKNAKGEFIPKYIGYWQLCYEGFTPENLATLTAIEGSQIFTDPIEAMNFKAGIVT